MYQYLKKKATHLQMRHPIDTEQPKVKAKGLLPVCLHLPGGTSLLNKFIGKKLRLHWKYQNIVVTCERVFCLMINGDFTSSLCPLQALK